MNISDNGLDFIVSFEGKLKPLPDGRYIAYRCPANVLTIYAGCTEGVTEGMTVTEDEGKAMFRRELAKHEAAVRRLVTVYLTQSQFDALVSFSYNVGSGALAKSKLLKKLNEKDYLGAADEFRYFTKARDPKTNKKVVLKGLVRRRKAESALFTSDMPGADDMPQTAVESRPIGVVIKENKETITAAATVLGGGGATVATQQAPAPKPDPKATIAKAKDTAKEVREHVEVAKDYYSWAKPTAVAAWENVYVVGPLVAVVGLTIFWPRIKERLPWG